MVTEETNGLEFSDHVAIITTNQVLVNAVDHRF